MRRLAAGASAALLLLAVAAGCAPSSPRVRTVALDGVSDARGLSLRGDTFVVVDAGGIAVLDRDAGGIVARHQVGEHGLAGADYKDVAALDDGTFLLIEDSEGTVYDPAAETQVVRFCVEPGFEPGPVLAQKNDALAVAGDTILANPRFYDASNDALMSSTLRAYRLDDGAPENDVEVDVELRGLASGIDGLYGVHDDTLEVLTTGGERVASATLDGTKDAAGVAVDDEAGELLVLDAAAAAVDVYDLDAIPRR